MDSRSSDGTARSPCAPGRAGGAGRRGAPRRRRPGAARARRCGRAWRWLPARSWCGSTPTSWTSTPRSSPACSARCCTSPRSGYVKALYRRALGDDADERRAGHGDLRPAADQPLLPGAGRVRPAAVRRGGGAAGAPARGALLLRLRRGARAADRPQPPRRPRSAGAGRPGRPATSTSPPRRSGRWPRPSPRRCSAAWRRGARARGGRQRHLRRGPSGRAAATCWARSTRGRGCGRRWRRPPRSGRDGGLGHRLRALARDRVPCPQGRPGAADARARRLGPLRQGEHLGGGAGGGAPAPLPAESAGRSRSIGVRPAPAAGEAARPGTARMRARRCRRRR